MRKFFSQKSKQKAHQHQTLTGSSSPVVLPLLFNKDDETQITTITKKAKPQLASSHSQTVAIETDTSVDNESIPSEIKTTNQVKQDEKSKKLFVVVSGKKTCFN
jgi:hypothetical protein